MMNVRACTWSEDDPRAIAILNAVVEAIPELAAKVTGSQLGA
jgi:hypothetical protein